MKPVGSLTIRQADNEYFIVYYRKYNELVDNVEVYYGVEEVLRLVAAHLTTRDGQDQAVGYQLKWEPPTVDLAPPKRVVKKRRRAR